MKRMDLLCFDFFSIRIFTPCDAHNSKLFLLCFVKRLTVELEGIDLRNRKLVVSGEKVKSSLASTGDSRISDETSTVPG